MIDNRMKSVRAKPKAIWYAWFPGDYASKTATLTLVEHGAYRVLLDHYYEMHGSMVANATLLLRVCRAFDPAEVAAVHAVLARYFVERDGYYHHERADAELAKRALLREKRAAAGSKGGKQKVANATNLLDVCKDVCHPQQQLQHSKIEELEPTSVATTSVSSNPEIHNLAEPLLVRAEPEPHPRPASKAISSKVQRGTRWPADAVVPDDWIADAAARRKAHGKPPIDLALEAEKFQNFWSAKSGKDATKVDWRATWRNWTLNTNGAYANGKGQFGRSVIDDNPQGNFAAIAARLRADREGRETFDA